MGGGPKVCEGNAVKQDEVARYVCDAIERHFPNPKVVKRLRNELHRQVERDNPKVNSGRVRKQLATIENKLAKAKRRLVEVDADMVPVVQENIRELRHEQERLESALQVAQTPRERVLGEADQRIDQAIRQDVWTPG